MKTNILQLQNNYHKCQLYNIKIHYIVKISYLRKIELHTKGVKKRHIAF